MVGKAKKAKCGWLVENRCRRQNTEAEKGELIREGKHDLMLTTGSLL